MQRWLAQSDLLAGLLATATFGAAVFAVGASIPVALLPAGLAYAGARLALGRRQQISGQDPADAATTLAACESRLAAIRALAAQLDANAHADARRQIVNIAASAERILVAVRQDTNKRDAAPRLADALSTIHTVVERYVRLTSRGLEFAPAREALLKTEQETLPYLQHWLDEQHEQLHLGDLAELTVDSGMIGLLLEPIEPEPGGRRGRPGR